MGRIVLLIQAKGFLQEKGLERWLVRVEWDMNFDAGLGKKVHFAVGFVVVTAGWGAAVLAVKFLFLF